MKIIWVLFVLLVISNSAYADVSARIYECTINGQRVFSDHACGDDAVQRDVTVTNRMDTIKPQPSKATASRSKRKRPSSSGSYARRQRCLLIRKSKDALVERMRAGYTAREDERLHNQLRKLDSEYFELRCSGVQ